MRSQIKSILCLTVFGMLHVSASLAAEPNSRAQDLDGLMAEDPILFDETCAGCTSPSGYFDASFSRTDKDQNFESSCWGLTDKKKNAAVEEMIKASGNDPATICGSGTCPSGESCKPMGLTNEFSGLGFETPGFPPCVYYNVPVAKKNGSNGSSFNFRFKVICECI